MSQESPQVPWMSQHLMDVFDTPKDTLSGDGSREMMVLLDTCIVTGSVVLWEHQ